jgi:HEPN domain-containing protein
MSQAHQSHDLAYWYADFSTGLFRLGEANFNECKYPETLDNFQDCLEFSIKVLFEFAGVTYPPIHNLSSMIISLATSYPTFTQELSRVAVSTSHWLGTTHFIPRYGVQNLGISPQRIYNKTIVKTARRDAKVAYKLMQQILILQKRTHPRNIGILNGYVEGSRFRENACNSRPATTFSGSQWKQSFENFQSYSGNPKYNVHEICAAEINSKYSMVINPFGEAYPEHDSVNRPIFNKIKDYVWGGGVFVNAGGFAFFYTWDVKQNQLIPISETRTLVPSAILVHPQTRQAVIQQFNRTIEFTGTLLWKELGAITTFDTPAHSGPYNVQVSQRRSDRQKGGNLVNIGGTSTVREFRALRNGTRNLFPILRSTRPGFGDIYSIAAIKYGHGYFLIIGMHVSTNSEYEKTISATDNFLNWVLR